MRKKLLKKLLCFALIAIAIMKSYVFASVADGSAFITKKEFDEALADFNARLTTFEAGINAKIDSQVSSYLDRNGVWNEVTQTCNYSTTALERTLISQNFTSAGTSIGITTVIPNVSKTGLCFFTVDCVGAGAYRNATDTKVYWEGTCQILEKMVNQNASNAEYSSAVISDFSVRGGGDSCSIFQPCVAVASGKRPYMFFVRKGDKVGIDYVFKTLNSGGATHKFDRQAGNDGKMNVKFEASVY